MSGLAVVLGVGGVLALCMLLVVGFARADRWLHLRSLQRKARAAVAAQGIEAVLAEIDEELRDLGDEKRGIKGSAAAYSTFGSGPGAVIALNARIVELEAYRRVVTRVSEEREHVPGRR